MSTDDSKQKRPHPRTGYRKPGAKRATLALRMTEEDKVLLQEQAAAVGKSVGDHVVAMAQEYRDNPFWDPHPTEVRRGPACPSCKSDESHPAYGDLSWDEKDMPQYVKQGLKAGETPFTCWHCGHCWSGHWPAEDDAKRRTESS